MTTSAHAIAQPSPPRIVLPDPLLIGLVGPAGCGKDTAAAHLVAAHHFEPYSFADPLREMLEAMLNTAGIDYAYIHERKLKELPIPGLGVSYRHLAQTLGTEWGRNCIAPDLWVRLAELSLGLPESPVHDRLVVTDVRFMNEAAMIRGHRGLLVRIVRDADPVRSHVSETELRGVDCHRTIYNTSSVDYLHDQLDALIEQIEDGRIAP